MCVTRENLSVCKAFVDFWDHKLERPLRPITSSIGSPVYAVSKHLVSILAPLRKNSYTVKNSAEFVHGLKQYSIADDEIMLSFDVKSLFTGLHSGGFSTYHHQREASTGSKRSRMYKHDCLLPT